MFNFLKFNGNEIYFMKRTVGSFMNSGKKGHYWLFLILVAVIGGLAFVYFVPSLFSILPRHMAFNRTEAIQAAGRHLRDLGYQPGDYQADASLQIRRDLIQYIERQYKAGDRDSVLRRLPAYAWQINWTKPKEDDSIPGVSRGDFPDAFNEVVLQIDAYGTPVAFWVQIDTESLRVNLKDSVARAMADSVVRAALGKEAASFTLNKSNSNTHERHTEQFFTYNRSEPVCGLQQQLNVVISGPYVSKFALQYNPPAISSLEKERAIQVFPFITLIFSLGMLCVVQLIRKLRVDAINFQYTLAPALAAGLLAVGMIVLEANRLDLFSLFLGVTIYAATAALAMVVAVAVGESTVRQLWDDKLLNLDAMLRGQFRHRHLAIALLRGLAFGVGLAGLIALTMKAAGLFTSISLAEWCADLHRDAASVPFMVSLIRIFNDALWTQFAVVLALLPILVKWLPRQKYAAPIFALIFGIGMHHTIKLPSEPLAANLIVGLILGLAFAYLFLRYDFITVFTAHITFATLFAAARLLSLNHPTFWYSGLMLLIPLFALVAFSGWAWPVYKSHEQLRNYLPHQSVKILENERLKRELEIARRVQMSFLPKQLPELPGLEVSSSCLPASEVGGDYYDFVPMGDNRIGFAIGDVSGKGVSAAFYMTLTKGFVRSLSRTQWGPAQILIEINRLFYESVERGHFVSLIFGVLDLNEMTLTFARAGHDPIFWCRHQDDHFERLLPPGIALGLEPGEVFSEIIKEQTIKVQAGDLFVLYTDGFSEAMNQFANEFGEERLAQSVRRHAHLPTDEIMEKIKTQVSHFVGRSPQHDDMTMLIMRIRGKS